MSRPIVEVVAFDVNETLFSLDRLGPAFAGAGLDARSVPLWFARILRDGFGLAVHGEYVPFADVAREQLRALDPTLDNQAVATVLTAFHHLDAYPDVEPAFQLLRAAGVRVITLTNGSAEWIASLLTQAGLSSYVERNVSIDDVRRWKPAPDVYLYAAAVTRVAPNQLALVSGHAHDCDAATRTGLVAGWVNRRALPRPRYFKPPNVERRALTEVVDSLLRGDYWRVAHVCVGEGVTSVH